MAKAMVYVCACVTASSAAFNGFTIEASIIYAAMIAGYDK